MCNENLEQENEILLSQFQVLTEINTIFLSLNTNFWLRGGWAIDIILGKITRPHSDVDLVALVDDRIQLEQALVVAWFRKIPISEYQTDFLKNNVDVSLIFVTRSKEGQFIPTDISGWIGRSDALSTQTIASSQHFIIRLTPTTIA